MVSWNVDGLDDKYLDERAHEVCSILLEDADRKPAIVLLQEVSDLFSVSCV